MRYDPAKIEQKWQKRWQKEGIYEPDFTPRQARGKRPFYNLMMFPYPSAEGLHIGSVRTFTGIDIYGRFKRMQGYDVFEPIGLDGFGIHSENYALKIGKHPFQHAKDSEKNFYRQLGAIGNGFAWREKLETYDPKYYRWTQWIFTQMFKRGLAYRKKSPVNWCPSCKTVLADEQVLQGECERCQSKVIKKDLAQWFFKITDYAERLLKNLGKIDWPEPIKIAQRNWIGRSEGSLIRFSVKIGTNYVLLHGYKGSPDRDFFPWLKLELEKGGYQVYAPELPNSAEPIIETQVEFLLKNYDFNADTVLVTHSLGGVVAMKLLPRLKTKIKKLVMVAPPLRTEFLDGKRREPLEQATDWKFDFEAVRNAAAEVVVIQDIKDCVVPTSQPQEIAKYLKAELKKVVAPAPHFNCPEAKDIFYEATRYEKTLKFDLPKIPGIFSGDKFITVRLYPKGLKVGDVCELIDSTSGRRFAMATITNVEERKLKDVPEKGRGLQQFRNRGEFYKTLKKYYHTNVSDNTDTWLYQFKLIDNYIEVFTTRPDTLFGATYMVLAPEHPLIKNLELRIKNLGEVSEYVKKAKAKTDEERIAEGKEKTGVELRGVKAINPVNGEEISVWVADYVLGNVGTGAIMAVPAHDERDFEFAKKFKLPIREVILQTFGKKKEGAVFRDSVAAIFTRLSDDKILILFNRKTDEYEIPGGGRDQNDDDLTTVTREIKEETGYTDFKIKGYLGQIATNFFAVGRSVERTKHQKAYHVILLSENTIPLQSDEHEDYEQHWMNPREAIEKLDSNVHKSYESEFIKRFINQPLVCYTGDGELVNSGKFDGMDSEKAKWEITRFVGGERKVQYRLRDWLISRQRYWGPPIPMIYCPACVKASAGKENTGWQPVSEKDLPVRLPYIKDFRPTGTDKSPLATVEKFYKVRCPKCRSWARRETDVSDTFLDSAWYYIGYLAKENSKFEIRNSRFRSIAKRWLPVNMYIGGAEHAVLHLLYVRFLAMALYDWKLVHFEEPFKKFRTHGLITKDGAKMSKSKGNVVNPDDYVRAYGSDAIRMYLAFLAPLTQGGDFRDDGIRGLTRFLERVWRLCGKIKDKGQKIKKEKLNLQRIVHRTIKKVTEDIENLQYNTAISALMVLLNQFEASADAVSKEDIKIFLKLLAPFAPHLAEELWQQIQDKGERIKDKGPRSIHLESWSKYDPQLTQEETFELVIQVNGRMRGKVTLPIGTKEAESKKAALAEAGVKQYVTKEPRRIVFVPNKLINFVV